MDRAHRAIVCSCLWGAGALLSGAAWGGEDLGPRKIESLGCHNVDTTCYVSVAGPIFGSTLGCPVGATNVFRFDNGDLAGQRAYASLLAAHLSSRPVSVFLDGCTVQGYPKLFYYWVLS